MAKFKKGDIIVPAHNRLANTVDDVRREVLEVGDTFYTLRFLGGKQLVVKWPIAGVDGDHKEVV